MLWSWAVVFLLIPLFLLQCFSKKKARPPAKTTKVKPVSQSFSGSDHPRESTTMSQKQQSKEDSVVSKRAQSEQLKFTMPWNNADDDQVKTLLPSLDEGENPLLRPEVQQKMRVGKDGKEINKMDGKQEQLRVDRTQEDRTARVTKTDEGQTEVTVELDRQYNQQGAAKKYTPKSAANNKKIACPEVKATASKEKKEASTMETMTQMSAPMFTVDKTTTVMMTVTTLRDPPNAKKSSEGVAVKSGYC